MDDVLLQGLKNHAVTMFEVGKLADETMDSFIVELGKVWGDDHVISTFDHVISGDGTG